ncbi:MAG: hypothetical protein R3C03_20210 [Pirellulaceae bacterium]
MSAEAPVKTQSRRPASKSQQFVEQQIATTGTQLKFNDLITGLIMVVGWGLLIMLVAVVTDAWLRPLGAMGRLAFLVVAAGGAVTILAFRVWNSVFRKVNPKYSCQMIEASNGKFKNSLLNYAYASEDPTVQEKGALVQAISTRAARDLSEVSHLDKIDRSSAIRMAIIAVSLFALFVAYAILSPKKPWSTLARVLAPFSEIASPSIVRIVEVTPGDTEVFFGERLLVNATIAGSHSPDDVRLVYSTADGRFSDAILSMQPTDLANRYQVELSTTNNGIDGDVIYRIEARDGRSVNYNVTVNENPTIMVESLVIVPPSYTKLPKKELRRTEPFSGVEGSMVTVNASANLQIRSAQLELLRANATGNYEHVQNIAMPHEGNHATGQFDLLLNRARDAQEFTHFRLNFVSESGKKNEIINTYPIRITPDLAPAISFVKPTDTQPRVAQNGNLLLEVQAHDIDYEISQLRLVIDHQASILRDEIIELESVKELQQVKGTYKLSPQKLMLEPNDVVVIYVEAADNRTSARTKAHEPNITRTANLILTIDPPAEPQGQDTENSENDGDDETNSSENADDQQPNEGAEQNSDDMNQDGSDEKQGDSRNNESDPSSEPGSDSSNEPQSSENGSDQQGNTSDSEKQDEGAESQTGDQSNDQGDGKRQNQANADDSTASQEKNGDEPDSNGSQSAANDQKGNDSEKGSAGSQSEQDNQGNPSDASSGNSQGNKSNSGTQGDPSGDSESGNKSGDGADAKSGNDSASNSDSSLPNGEKSSQSSGQKSNSPSNGGNDSANGDETRDESLMNGDEERLSEDASDRERFDYLKRMIEEQKDKPRSPESQASESNDPAQESGQPQNQNNSNSSNAKSNSNEQRSNSQNDSTSSKPNKSQNSSDSEKDSGNSQDPNESQENSGDPQNPQSSAPETQANKNQPEESEAGNPEQDSANEAKGSSNPSGDSQQGSKDGTESSEEQKSGKNPDGKKSDDSPSNSEQQESEKNEGSDQQSEKQPSGSQQENSTQQKDGSDSQLKNQPQSNSSEPKPGESQSNQSQSDSASNRNSTSAETLTGTPSVSPSSQSSSGGGNATTASPSGSDSGSAMTPEEKENIDYSKEVTELVLKSLRDQKNNPDPELLDNLNMTADEFAEFLSRWEEMAAKARKGNPDDIRKYERALQSLGLQPASQRKRQIQGSQQMKELSEGESINRVSREFEDEFNAFMRSRNRVKNADK